MDVKTISLDEILNSISSVDLPDPTQYQYYSNLQNRKIIVNGEITDAIVEYATLPLMQMDNDGTGEPIELILNTLGGDLFSGLTLVDAIERVKTPLTVRILGIAASMGFYIAIAGHNNPNVKTICSPFSVGLLHGGSLELEGTQYAIKDQINFLQNYEEKLKKFVVSHTKITPRFYKKIERNEYWLDAEEMLKYGVVDEII